MPAHIVEVLLKLALAAFISMACTAAVLLAIPVQQASPGIEMREAEGCYIYTVEGGQQWADCRPRKGIM